MRAPPVRAFASGASFRNRDGEQLDRCRLQGKVHCEEFSLIPACPCICRFVIRELEHSARMGVLGNGCRLNWWMGRGEKSREAGSRAAGQAIRQAAGRRRWRPPGTVQFAWAVVAAAQKRPHVLHWPSPAAAPPPAIDCYVRRPRLSNHFTRCAIPSTSPTRPAHELPHTYPLRLLDRAHISFPALPPHLRPPSPALR